MTRFRRREILGAPALLLLARRAGAARADYPFTLGVASGDPAPDGMVLWTRLAPRPLEADGGMPPVPVAVRWEVSADARFADIVRAGTAMATPEWGHSVHVEVGGLRPDRRYWYRFIADGVASAAGCTRTAPARDALVDRLRICFTSCHKYEAGFYAGWRHAAADDPDLILFLGDYIYENAPTDHGVRPHRNPEPFDVAGYRIRYATYKLDPDLQAAHAAAPWAVTWDDHEVANNYAADLDEHNGDRTVFARRRAAAYKVYWEHMPLRLSARPDDGAAILYRTIDWGRLAQFQIVDDRQYRSGHACQPPDLLPAHRDYIDMVPDCAERHDPARSILGARQEAWLLDRLGATDARWNLLAEQAVMTPFAAIDPAHPDLGPRLHSLDTWEGYPVSRDRILRRWRDAHVPNPIVLSGDIHAFVAADMTDPDDPARMIASEFGGGSMTSLNPDPLLKPGMLANPGFHFAENMVRGYGRADITAEACRVTFQGLADARDPHSGIGTLAGFDVAAGRAGMVRA